MRKSAATAICRILRWDDQVLEYSKNRLIDCLFWDLTEATQDAIKLNDRFTSLIFPFVSH